MVNHHNGFVATHALGLMMYGYIYVYYMVFTAEGFFEVATERSCPELDLIL